jgi:hypothetical protein
MRRLARTVLMAMVVSLLTAGASTAIASSPTTTLTGQTAIDPAVCKDLKSRLYVAVHSPGGRSRADARSIATIEHFDLGNGSDCLFKSYETRPASNIASANYIQGFWKSMELYVGPWDAGSIHVDVGMVITGSIATKVGGWGAKCYFHWNLPSIFGGGFTWCGVWNNGHWYTEPGADYFVFVYPNTWAPRTGYMRYCVEGQGVWCNPWGAMN